MTRTKDQFEDRVRFNWGYHDAALAVEQHWDTWDRNFGFGPCIKVSCPADVLLHHFDRAFAHGWTLGYRDAKDGTYQGNSSAAWEEHMGTKRTAAQWSDQTARYQRMAQHN